MRSRCKSARSEYATEFLHPTPPGLKEQAQATSLLVDTDIEPEQQNRPHEDRSDQCQHAAGRLQVVEVAVRGGHDHTNHHVHDEEEAWSSHAGSLPAAGEARTNGSVGSFQHHASIRSRVSEPHAVAALPATATHRVLLPSATHPGCSYFARGATGRV